MGEETLCFCFTDPSQHFGIGLMAQWPTPDFNICDVFIVLSWGDSQELLRFQKERHPNMLLTSIVSLVREDDLHMLYSDSRINSMT